MTAKQQIKSIKYSSVKYSSVTQIWNH